MTINSRDKRDVYYFMAKQNNYRARSIFKLKQIDEKYNVFNDTDINVLDLCAAPGSWSQYLSELKANRKNINNIIEYNDSIVKLIKSITFNYSYPQLAREVLNNYHKKMNEIRSICKIYYENIDAILINEEDYKKLEEKGFIGNELGKFKIEHIFKEIAISSSRKFVGILEDNSQFIHLPKKDINYNEFVDEIKNNVYTTIY